MNYIINDLPHFNKTADPSGRIQKLLTKNMNPVRIVPGRLKINFIDYVLKQGLFDNKSEDEQNKNAANDIIGAENDLFTFQREMSHYSNNLRNILYIMGKNLGFSNGELTDFITDVGLIGVFKKAVEGLITSSKDSKTKKEVNTMVEFKDTDGTETGTVTKGEEITNLIRDIYITSLTGYVDVSSDGSYSFSNSYKDSVILSSLDDMISGNFFGNLSDGIIDTARETINYSGKAADVANKIKQGNKDDSMIAQATDALTKLASTKLVVPKVWDTSSASSSIELVFKLKAPFGDRHTIFNTVLSPFAMLLCLAIPQQSVNLGFAMPYILAVDSPGVVQSPACVITSMTYTRGGDSNLWSVDGLPLEMTIHLTLEDVFDNIYLPTTTKIYEGMTKALNSNPLFYSFLNNITGYSPSSASISEKIGGAISNFMFNALNSPISYIETEFEKKKDTSGASKGGKLFTTMKDFFS